MNLMGAIKGAFKPHGPFTYKFPDVPVKEVPKGPYEVEVYTYYGSPMEKIKRAQNFTLDVLPGKWSMKSEYTGTEWEDDGALAYKGRPIGFTHGSGIATRHLMKLADEYGHVIVHARKVRTSEYGWPEIVLLLPEEMFSVKGI